ncbi:MAG: response regulator transcription factor [Muribaculaceae bacterium]|nr:response regulator transcription factor [Muribaculaceae bacterium]
MQPNVVIVMLNALAAQGLRLWLTEHCSLQAHVARSISEIADSNAIEGAQFITDATTFVANLRFFLPRQACTIVLTQHQPTVTDGSVTLMDANNTDNLLQQLTHRFDSASPTNATASSQLSQREIEVLRLVTQGLMNKEIADALKISINTVLTHRKNITAKLGIKSVSGLTFYALMNGITTR